MEATLHEVRRAPLGDEALETVLTHPAGAVEGGALLFSPQPFLGGDLDNNVLRALTALLAARGLGVLRFNYRGVGASADVVAGQSRYEYWKRVEAEGDLSAVLADGRAAFARAARLLRPTLLAGYSYGAAVALHVAVEQAPATPLVLVAPPLARLDFEALADHRGPALVVLAGRDALTPPPPLAELAGRFPRARLAVLPEADHFLLGREHELAEPLAAFLAELPPS